MTTCRKHAGRCSTHGTTLLKASGVWRCPVVEDTLTWTTREGEPLFVDLMDPGHAANVIAFLENRAVGLLRNQAMHALAHLPTEDQTGEMALDTLEHEVHRLFNLSERAVDDHQVALDWLWEERHDLLTALAARTVPA